MISTNISNIKKINMAYDSTERRLNSSISKLRSDYEEFTKGNVFYKKVGVGKIILSIIVDLVLIYGLLQSAFIVTWIQQSVDFSEYSAEEVNSTSVFLSLIFWILLIICAYCIFNTGVMFYCKKIEGYSSRINKVEKKATEALGQLKAAQLNTTLVKAAMNNEEYSIDSKNSLGSEIASIRTGFMNTNQKAYNVKKILSIGVSAILFAFLLIYMLVKVRGNLGVSATGGVTVALLCGVATAVISITQFNAGEYMSRFSKLVGCAMAIVYGLVLGLCLKGSYSIPAGEIELIGFAQKLNYISIVVPFLQILGICLVVCLSHYGLEKDKWQNGFEVPMTFLSKNNGNKNTLLVRGGIATFLAFVLCITVSEEAISGFGGIVLVAFIWYCSNCILKPRGSYLYTFWGRSRCIANEFVMAAMVIASATCGRGTISMDEIVCLGVAFIASYIIAGIVTAINNVI